MPKLTITTSIDLPDDEWERADLVAKAKPLPGVIRTWLGEQSIEGKVDYSFDGRKAPKNTGATAETTPITQATTLAPESVLKAAE